MFTVNKQYTKNDIYDILKVPASKRKGAWDTGYHKYLDDVYIFVNIGIEGRTGHNYKNYWKGNLLFWQAKNNSNINQPLIREILNSSTTKHIFTRTNNNLPFNYEGKGFVYRYYDKTPVEIVWSFDNLNRNEILPEEINYSDLKEGSVQEIKVNSYERNPIARKICIEHYGTKCMVCGFDFERTYGEIGKDYIHIHHIIPISTIQDEYIIDPIKELIPLCANCHAMIHRKNPPLSVEELLKMLKM